MPKTLQLTIKEDKIIKKITNVITIDKEQYIYTLEDLKWDKTH
jgi:hypothetical protein